MEQKQVVPEEMEQEEIVPAVSVQPVNINARCFLNPDPVRRKKLEGIRWMNNSAGDVDLCLPPEDIFCPSPPDPLPLPQGEWVTLYICDDTPPGKYSYSVRGAHCVHPAARIGNRRGKLRGVNDGRRTGRGARPLNLRLSPDQIWPQSPAVNTAAEASVDNPTHPC